jgi:hypothetical protein
VTQKWCKSCKLWFNVADGCEQCGYEGEGFNKGLATAKLNNHLFEQAHRAKKEHTDAAHFVRAAKAEQRRLARP